MDKESKIAKQLETEGFAIVPKVITEEQCDKLYDGFWSYMTELNPKLDPKDPETWTAENLPLTTKGLIQHYNVGFQRFNIDAHMLVKPVFEELYGTKKLWTSFDGVSFTKKDKTMFKDLKDWQEKCWKSSVHVDQTTPGFMSVQGGLAITNQEEDEHVFLCIPKSHLFHEKILELYDGKSFIPHFQVMKEKQLNFVKEQGLQMKRIPLKRGDMVLWDSRLIHYSAPYCSTAPKDAHRVHIFACMCPVPDNSKLVEGEMKKRKNAYETKRVSKHSPGKIRLFGAKPRLWNDKDKEKFEKTPIPESAKMTEEEQKLYGLINY